MDEVNSKDFNHAEKPRRRNSVFLIVHIYLLLVSKGIGSSTFRALVARQGSLLSRTTARIHFPIPFLVIRLDKFKKRKGAKHYKEYLASFQILNRTDVFHNRKIKSFSPITFIGFICFLSVSYHFSVDGLLQTKSQ